MLLSACTTTADYSFRYDSCMAQALKTYPVRNNVVRDTRPETYEVFTGQTSCTSSGSGSSVTTNCTQQKETKTRWVPISEIRDTNISARKFQATACTEERCISDFGNRECKGNRIFKK